MRKTGTFSVKRENVDLLLKNPLYPQKRLARKIRKLNENDLSKDKRLKGINFQEALTKRTKDLKKSKSLKKQLEKLNRSLLTQTSSVNEKTMDNAKLKQTKYFVNYLIKEENSLFYSTDRKKTET